MMRREGGNVVITITNDEFEKLLLALGFATGAVEHAMVRRSFLLLVNSINEGNPSFTPYEV